MMRSLPTLDQILAGDARPAVLDGLPDDVQSERGRVRFSPDAKAAKVEIVVRTYRETKSSVLAAQAAGVAAGTACRWLHEAGVRIRQRLNSYVDRSTPKHGRDLSLRLTGGRRITVRTRLKRRAALALANAYLETGQVTAAGAEIGMAPRVASMMLEKWGLHDRGAGYAELTTNERHRYRSQATGEVVWSLYPFGLLRRAETLYVEEMLPVREVVERLGGEAFVCYDTLCDLFERMGIKRSAAYQHRITRARRQGFATPEARDAEIRERMEGGQSLTSVATDLQVSLNVVRRVRDEMGRRTTSAKQRSRLAQQTRRANGLTSGKASDPAQLARRREEVHRLRHEDGLSVLQIAAQLRVSRGTVYADLAREAPLLAAAGGAYRSEPSGDGAAGQGREPEVLPTNS